MKKLAKWLLGLSIIFVGGLVTSAGLAGHIYFNEVQTYENAFKKEINANALEELHIRSQVPVSICLTDGAPYVEFEQKHVDFMGKAPTYKVEVTEQGKGSYININLENEGMDFFVKEDVAKATVYLPKKALNELSLDTNTRYYWSYFNKAVIDLSGLNIKNVNLNANNTSITLNGDYEKINISGESTIKVHSNQPAEVTVSNGESLYLTGQYTRVTSSADRLEMDSEVPAEVIINYHNSEVNLRGKYSKVIRKDGCDNLSLDSKTPCEVDLKGQDGTITLTGAIKKLSSDNENSTLSVTTTIIPSSINLLNSEEEAQITLPSNIPGLTLNYVTRDFDEETFEEPISDYKLAKTTNLNESISYTFGDGSIKMNSASSYDYPLRIIDGGYNSQVMGE